MNKANKGQKTKGKVAKIKLVWNRKNLSVKEEQIIYIYIYLDGRKMYFSTGIKVKRKFWDNGRINHKHPNHIEYNQTLKELIQDLENYQYQIYLKRKVTIEDFESYFSPEPDRDFLSFCKKINDQDNRVSNATKENRRQFTLHLQNAFKNFLPVEGINYEVVEKFDRYLRNKNLAENTINKHHIRFKFFLNELINRDIIKKNPYDNFKLKRVRDKKQVIWYDEINSIMGKRYKGAMEISRLKFLFSCFTGLRVSDTNVIRWSDIKNNKIVITQTKTDRNVVIPLDYFPETETIISQIKSLFPGDGLIFPTISDTLYNSRLKIIAIDNQLSIRLTSHVARHTFCTLVAHKSQSVFKVMEMAGIGKTETAMIYINLQKIFS